MAACNPSSQVCLNNNLASPTVPESEAIIKTVRREACPNRDSMATKLRKVFHPPLLAIRAGRIHRLMIILPLLPHQPLAYPQGCQAPFPTPTRPSTTEPSTPLPPSTNSMPWVDTSNKESATITDMLDINSSEALFKVDSDTLKLWDKAVDTVPLTMMIKVTRVPRTTPHLVATKIRAVAEAVVTVDEIRTTTTSIRTSTTPSTADTVDNPMEWVTTGMHREE